MNDNAKKKGLIKMKFRPEQCPKCEHYREPYICFNPFPSKYDNIIGVRPTGWVTPKIIAKNKCSRFKKKVD